MQQFRDAVLDRHQTREEPKRPRINSSTLCGRKIAQVPRKALGFDRIASPLARLAGATDAISRGGGAASGGGGADPHSKSLPVCNRLRVGGEGAKLSRGLQDTSGRRARRPQAHPGAPGSLPLSAAGATSTLEGSYISELRSAVA